MIFHGYGLIVGIAMVLGWWWASRWWDKQGQPTSLDAIGIWAVVGGIVGARTYHVVDYWWYYQQHLGEVVALWRGGLAIWGAVLGGVVAVWLVSLHKRISFLLVLDVLATALPLSQAVGRWGNWVNFELYGKPTSLPWGWWIPPAYRPEQLKEMAYYHPLFLYEFLLLSGLFLFIHRWGLTRFRFGSGGIFGLYLFGYGLIRFLLEPLRLSAWTIHGVLVAQAVSVVALIVGICLCLCVGWDYVKKETSSEK